MVSLKGTLNKVCKHRYGLSPSDKNVPSGTLFLACLTSVSSFIVATWILPCFRMKILPELYLRFFCKNTWQLMALNYCVKSSIIDVDSILHTPLSFLLICSLLIGKFCQFQSMFFTKIHQNGERYWGQKICTSWWSVNFIVAFKKYVSYFGLFK